MKKKIIQWGLMTVLGLWGMVSFMVLAGEEAPEVCMTLGDFFLIKALAITSFSGCILCGKWLSKKGLLPEISIHGKATQLCPFWPRKICPPFCTI